MFFIIQSKQGKRDIVEFTQAETMRRAYPANEYQYWRYKETGHTAAYEDESRAKKQLQWLEGNRYMEFK